jgi:hypothetical protein
MEDGIKDAEFHGASISDLRLQLADFMGRSDELVWGIVCLGKGRRWYELGIASQLGDMTSQPEQNDARYNTQAKGKSANEPLRC